MGSPITSLADEVMGRGALAGAVAACDRRTQQSQIQNLLEVLGAYRYPESVRVLLLYIAYQVGRRQIERNTGRRIASDILYIVRNSGGDVDELLRKYLGALKWSYTAITRGGFYGVCRVVSRLRPSVEEIVKAILGIQ